MQYEYTPGVTTCVSVMEGPICRPQFCKMIWVSVLTILYPRNLSLPFSDPIRNYYQLLLLGIIYRDRIGSVRFCKHKSSSKLRDSVEESVQLNVSLGLPTTLSPLFVPKFVPEDDQNSFYPNFISSFVYMLLFHPGSQVSVNPCLIA
jgi:hypothetical protein